MAAALMLVPWLLEACSDEPSPVERPAETSEELTEALAEARSGEVVRLTGARYEGSFRVTAGVVVVGDGAVLATAVGGGTHIGNGRLCVLCLSSAAASTPTRVKGLAIESAGLGIAAEGDGVVVIEDVRVDASRGVGAVLGASEVRLSDVDLNGPIDTEEELAAIGAEIDPAATAVAGVVMSGARWRMERVAVRRFAGFGVVLHNSEGTWEEGEVVGNVGTSVLVEGGEAVVRQVAVRDGRQGGEAGYALEASGVVVSAAGRLVSEGLTVEDVNGIGLLQDNARSEHTDLVVSRNRFAGIWVQGDADAAHATALQVRGAGSRVAANLGLGVYFRDASGLVLDGVTIADTGARPQPDEVLGFVDVADGLQLAGASGQVELADAALMGNGRAGIVLDGAASDAIYSFRAVHVSAVDDGVVHGTVLQNATGLAIEGIVVEPAAVAARDAQARADGVVLPLTPKRDVIGTVASAVAAGLFGAGGLVGEDGQLRDGLVVNGNGALEVRR